MEEVSRSARQTLTVQEVADMLGFSTNSIYKFLKEGRIRAQRIGRGRFRIPRSEIQRLLETDAKITNEGERDLVDAVQTELPRVESLVAAKIERNGLPNLFYWYIGLTLTLLAISFFFHVPSLLTSIFAGLLGLNGLAFLALDLFGNKKRSWYVDLSVSAFIITLLTFLLTYGPSGLREVNALLFPLTGLLLLPLFERPLSLHRNFIYALVLWGIGQAFTLTFHVGPASRVLVWVLTAGLVAAFLWLEHWTRHSSRKGQVALFSVVALAFLALATWYTSRGAWNEAAFSLVLSTFTLIVPFREDFQHSFLHRRPAFSLLFLWIGVIFVVFLVAIRLLDIQLVNFYHSQAQQEAKRSGTVLADQLKHSQSLMEAMAENRAFVEAVHSASGPKIEPFARLLYEGADNSFNEVFVMDTHGQVITNYPIGTAQPLEDSAAARVSQEVTQTGRTLFSQPIIHGQDQAPLLIVATPITNSQGRITAVVAASLNYFALKSDLQNLQLTDGGRLLVLDQGQQYLFHPDSSLLGTKAVESDLANGFLTAAQSLLPMNWQIIGQYPISRVYRLSYPLIFVTLTALIIIITGSLALIMRLKLPALR